MGVAVKEILRANRPPGVPGRADKYLPDIARDLQWLLEKSRRGLSDRSVVWPEASLSELAAVLVEFGEDLHADSGLWRSLENYNRETPRNPLARGGSGACPPAHAGTRPGTTAPADAISARVSRSRPGHRRILQS